MERSEGVGGGREGVERGGRSEGGGREGVELGVECEVGGG